MRNVSAFNRLCFYLALQWLLVTIPLGIVWRPTAPDFGQFYMGGLIARQGEWYSLYPIPLPGSRDNPGLNIHSFAKPGWKALALIHGVPDYTRFILPPPSALPFIPLTFFSYVHAFWIWTFLLTMSVWGVAVTAALLYRRLAGQPTRTEGVLALLVAVSPMTCRAIRIANVSPPVALCIGLALLALMAPLNHKRPIVGAGAGAVLMGGLLKYATVILAPLILCMRRWRFLFWAVALGAAVVAITFLVAGKSPFLEFQHSIMPTLSRPSLFRGNQSLSGLLARVYGRPFPYRVALIFSAIRISSLAGILTLMATLPKKDWQSPANILAGAGLLLSWLLVFSPISWEHWPIFLCPMWGWLVWEGRHSGIRRVLAYSSLALMYFPAGIFQVRGIAAFPLYLPEPWNSFQLAGVMLFFGLAFWRLGNEIPATVPAPMPAPELREPLAMQEFAKMGKLD